MQSPMNIVYDAFTLASHGELLELSAAHGLPEHKDSQANVRGGELSLQRPWLPLSTRQSDFSL
jgi:hypothetical protein